MNKATKVMKVMKVMKVTKVTKAAASKKNKVVQPVKKVAKAVPMKRPSAMKPVKKCPSVTANLRSLAGGDSEYGPESIKCVEDLLSVTPSLDEKLTVLRTANITATDKMKLLGGAAFDHAEWKK
jgi:hypothetical protein